MKIRLNAECNEAKHKKDGIQLRTPSKQQIWNTRMFHTSVKNVL